MASSSPHAESHLQASPPSARLPDLDRAILIAVAYADVFDYPLTTGELYQQLVATSVERATFERALDHLLDSELTLLRTYIVLRGRERLVALREHRERVAPKLWKAANRYARWLAHVPFMRLVAVSGSLARNNAEDKGDIDFFCITAANRLWVARLFVVPLSKMTRTLKVLFPYYLCPNYIVTTDSLAIQDQNLFTAHEVAQAVPVWDSGVYRSFRTANKWIGDYLPQIDVHIEGPSLTDRPRSGFSRIAERLLNGRRGDSLNQFAFRLFETFYRRRAERAGWSWSSLAPAYQVSRYTVPEGGYAGVVHRLMVRRIRERFGRRFSIQDLERLFPSTSMRSNETVYDWENLFEQDYGKEP